MSTAHLAGLGLLALVVGADAAGPHPQAVNEKLREYLARTRPSSAQFRSRGGANCRKWRPTSGRAPIRAGRHG